MQPCISDSECIEQCYISLVPRGFDPFDSRLYSTTFDLLILGVSRESNPSRIAVPTSTQYSHVSSSGYGRFI